MTITLTTTENQKNNINNNLTKIDLGQCENLLREVYNIHNKTIYMKKIDIVQEGIQIPKIKYDVYCKLNSSNLIKLYLTVCKNSKISLSIPIEISESLEKLNSSSEYYNNKCSKAKSDSGTDISINDRKKEFVEGNKTICQEDCDFSKYNSDDHLANCSCKVKESSSFSDININKTKLYENFEDNSNKKEVSNLGITSCNVLASKENIESNAGFFLLLIILALFIIIFIIFCTKGYNSLENKIDEIIYNKFEKETKTKKKKVKKSLITQIEIPPINKRHSKSDKIISNFNNSGKKPLQKRKRKSKQKNVVTIENDIQNNQSVSPSVKPDTDYELNWLSYEEAMRYDKRNNCDYYCSLIKNKQLFMFTFCSFNDYNSGIVKKFMLFLSFALHYTSNALFFDESNIHQIYEDEGKFNFEYQISHIIISTIASNLVLRIILQTLVLTDKDILQVKLQSTKTLAINMKKTKLKYMKIKFAIFFILNFILLVLFWYYLTCFNAIYQNTQVYLIENTFISFAFSLFYPFIINIFPTIFRMSSIHSSNKNKRYSYKLSQIIQLI